MSDKPTIAYGIPDPDCTACHGYGVRPKNDMVEWCECNTWELAHGPLCTDADGNPVSMKKFDCSEGCGAFAYLAPRDGVRFTCTKCRPPELFIYSGSANLGKYVGDGQGRKEFGFWMDDEPHIPTAPHEPRA